MKPPKLISLSTAELIIRIFTALFVAIYGLAKPLQFVTEQRLDTPVSELTGMQLMWAFFGYTLAYPIAIGLIQVIGAVLLVFERTKLWAALLLTPVFLNIIFLDILYDVNEGALFNAVLFQMVFFYIIFKERVKVINCFTSLLLSPIAFKNLKSRFLRFIIAAFVAVILFLVYPRLNAFIVGLWN